MNPFRIVLAFAIFLGFSVDVLNRPGQAPGAHKQRSGRAQAIDGRAIQQAGDLRFIQGRDQLHTPEKGSAERQAIMDGLREEYKENRDPDGKPYRGKLTFIVNYLKVHNGWAWVYADPQSSDSRDRFGENSGFLLHYEGGQWKVMNLPPRSDDPNAPEPLDYPTRKDVESIKRMYLSIPVDIFPSQAETSSAPSTNQSSDTNTDDSPTVRELYLLMPKQYDGSSRQEREEILEYTSETVVDIPHGYISYVTHLSGEVFEVALFKAPDGSRILAYNQDSDPRYNVPTKLYFLKYEGERWTDVTAQLLPEPVNKQHKYKLPQTGTTINVTDAKGRKLYEVAWKNGKFERQ